MMKLEEIIRKNRSIRRFYQDQAVDLETLRKLVNLGRISASGANRQPLKYILSGNPATNAEIFSCLAWAAYLTDWKGPEEGERPAAYIIVMGDKNISDNFGCDHGIACQSILLGATEIGLSGCMLGAVNREKLTQILKIPENLKILLVLAIGQAKEEPVLEPVGADGSIRYFRDDKGGHHVPKRDLNDIIIDSYQ
ncbi:nitroreductase family protein [Thermodesulfobacteriota bacterium]